MSILISGTSRWVNQLMGSMDKCSLSKKPHFISKRLILSKISCFGVEASWWGCFKGVSSLLGLRLAVNVDDLLDDVIGLFYSFLVPESDESSYYVSDELYEDDEDEESDDILIYLCAIWTRSCSFVCYIADFADCWYSGTCCSLFIQASI